MEVLDAANWTRWRVGVGASFFGRGLFRDGPKHAKPGQCENSKKNSEKGELPNRPQLQRMEVLDAQIWTRWRVGVGASFCARGLFRDGPKHAKPGQCERQKKAKKRRITESTVTPTYGGFRRSNLDTVAGWGWRIFLCEGVVQGRSKTRQTRSM